MRMRFPLLFYTHDILPLPEPRDHHCWAWPAYCIPSYAASCLECRTPARPQRIRTLRSTIILNKTDIFGQEGDSDIDDGSGNINIPVEWSPFFTNDFKICIVNIFIGIYPDGRRRFQQILTLHKREDLKTISKVPERALIFNLCNLSFTASEFWMLNTLFTVGKLRNCS